MARYTDESRERVRDAVDFAEVVGARTELKRSGVNRLQGLCPFHDERSPSFGINPVEKVYYCFGCGAGGDVFKFVMETENLSFGQALESLAERYRVPLERESEDPREAEQRQRRERLLALLERTAAYYVRVLWESADAAPAREYLSSRGLEEAALRAYRVGYAPDAWDKVVIGSRRSGFSEAELLAAGLAQRSSRGTLIDRFHGRITFPLADERGRVLGFGARAMHADQKPKYLNTSENNLFHKGKLVYGADMARAAAAKAGRVVLVEGYTDVIALHQAGVPETVAQMGTALTDAQVDGIARLAPKALFCQDPDRAGQESVAKGIAALRTHNKNRSTRGVEFRIVRLPAGQDPADVVQQAGADEMRVLLEKAIAIERFEVERALAQPDASTDEMLATVAPIIGGMPATILRDELVSLVAGRLGMSANLVNEALRSPALARAPFTAGTRDDLRGGGMPGRGGNPSSGWSSGGPAPQRPRPQQHTPAPQRRGPSHGGGSSHPGQTGAGAPPAGTSGAAPAGPRGTDAGPPSGGSREAPASAHPAGSSGAPTGGSSSGGAPHPGRPPAPAGGADGIPPSEATPSRAGDSAVPEDPFVDRPPPLEWDGFSGDDDFDPGAMGAPNELEPSTGASDASQRAGADPGPVAPPAAWQEPASSPQQGGGGQGDGWNTGWQPQPPQQQGWNREWQPRGGRQGGGGRGGRGNFRGGGGRDRYRRDMPPPEPMDPRAMLARREEHELAFLAFCIALPEQGERRLETVDVDEYFSAPTTRRAAAYLRGRLRSPTAHLPAGDEALARIVAELVVRSDTLEATVAKLDLEGLQLDLHRVERRISSPQVTGDERAELNRERQRILDEFRTKMT